jgi:superfamily II DNA/RNA helicase
VIARTQLDIDRPRIVLIHLVIRKARREIRVLLCSDAASEGLNLQVASALINYDLPWNPARVEQRIGRIDRIGRVGCTAE